MNRNAQALQEELALSAVRSHALFPGRTTLYVYEVSRALQISENQVINLIESGKLAAVNIGNGSKGKRFWRIPVSAFDAYVGSHNSITSQT